MVLDYDNINFYKYRDNFKDFEHVKSTLMFGDFNSPIPTYTIVIPTLKRPDLFEETLKSAINQNGFRDYEIIILDIDPEKNNETQKVIEKYKKHKNIFSYQCEDILHGWNRALQLVRTEWVTVLSDDDILFPNYLYTVDNILKKHPEIEGLAPKYNFLIYDFLNKKVVNNDQSSINFKGSFPKQLKGFLRKYNIIPQKKQVFQVGNYIMDSYYLRNAAFAPHCLMYKTKNILSLGGYNPTWYHGSLDFILHVNYMLKFNLYYTTEVLGLKREGIGNSSSMKEVQICFVLLAYRFYMDQASQNHLKHLKFDEWFIRTTAFYMAIAEAKLDFKEVNYLGWFDEKDYNWDCLNEFRAKWAEYAKQLEEACPALDRYTYNHFHHLVWK